MNILIITGIIILIIFAVFMFTERKVKWHSDPAEKNGRPVFQAHLENHPWDYSLKELLWMSNRISFFKMLTTPAFYKTIPPFFLYKYSSKYKSKIGEPAPDFDLPTTDGSRICLSALKGKIAAFMFVSCT